MAERQGQKAAALFKQLHQPGDGQVNHHTCELIKCFESVHSGSASCAYNGSDLSLN